MIFLLLLSSFMRFEAYNPITRCDIFYHILLQAALSSVDRVKMLNSFYHSHLFLDDSFFLE
ncbi:hypothetical protein GIB67_020163 [Kingdonia uniflora]|uniref:Uncharacterized protein n=1 Tax=Kingdonia uniflora TaxID=39325 RepID=A0A7J7NJS0_9MAGN|nr:hypothetical protein GIB67_023825 [Kingdonia uniflora]KAF6167427.1 hypothetical protein GIB67_020163 [Kingdonia uniflora]